MNVLKEITYYVRNIYLFTEIININQVTIIYTVVEYKTKFNHTILTRARQA